MSENTASDNSLVTAVATAAYEQEQEKAEKKQNASKPQQQPKPKQPEKKEQPEKPSNVPKGEERKKFHNKNREQKKKEEHPTQTATTKEKSESDKLSCPYCGQPLRYDENAMQYIHEISRRNCNKHFRDSDEIERCKAEIKKKSESQDKLQKQPAAEAETSASSNNQKPQNTSSNQNNKQKKNETSAKIEVIEVEDISEDAIKAKLGLLEDESQKSKVLEDGENSSKPDPEGGDGLTNHFPQNLESSSDSNEKIEIPKVQEEPEEPEQPKQEASVNSNIVGGINKKGKNKLRNKMTKFKEGDEEKMEEYAKGALEEIEEGRKRGVIIRNGKPVEENTKKVPPVSDGKTENAENTQSSNSLNDVPAPTEKEKEEPLEEPEVYSGKTTLLTEEVPETQKIFPTLTDVETGKIITIEQPETLIGRDKDCQIIINEKVISHKHAYIILKNDKAYMIDNGSSNGTFAMEDMEETNKFRLPKDLEVEIKDGSIIMLADRKYKFSLEG